MFVWVMGPKAKNEGVFFFSCLARLAGAGRPKSPRRWHAAHGYAIPVIGIMAEWLRRQTRNLVGSARVGSNPADVVSSIFFRFLFFRAAGPSPMHKTPKRRVQVAKGHAGMLVLRRGQFRSY